MPMSEEIDVDRVIDQIEDRTLDMDQVQALERTHAEVLEEHDFHP